MWFGEEAEDGKVVLRVMQGTVRRCCGRIGRLNSEAVMASLVSRTQRWSRMSITFTWVATGMVARHGKAPTVWQGMVMGGYGVVAGAAC